LLGQTEHGIVNPSDNLTPEELHDYYGVTNPDPLGERGRLERAPMTLRKGGLIQAMDGDRGRGRLVKDRNDSLPSSCRIPDNPVHLKMIMMQSFFYCVGLD